MFLYLYKICCKILTHNQYCYYNQPVLILSTIFDSTQFYIKTIIYAEKGNIYCNTCGGNTIYDINCNKVSPEEIFNKYSFNLNDLKKDSIEK
jgi:hypothetical protein